MANEDVNIGKIIEGISLVTKGLQLFLEFLEAEKRAGNLSTEELNARSSELHSNIKKMLDEDLKRLQEKLGISLEIQE